MCVTYVFLNACFIMFPTSMRIMMHPRWKHTVTYGIPLNILIYYLWIYIICIYIYISSFASMFFILAVAHCVLILGQTILLKHPSIHISREARRNTSFIEWWNSERTSNNHSWINNLHMFNLILKSQQRIFPWIHLQIQSVTLIMLPFLIYLVVRQWWCSVADSPKISTGEILAPSIERLGLSYGHGMLLGAMGHGCKSRHAYSFWNIVQHISCKKVWYILYTITYPCCPYF